MEWGEGFDRASARRSSLWGGVDTKLGTVGKLAIFANLSNGSKSLERKGLAGATLRDRTGDLLITKNVLRLQTLQ